MITAYRWESNWKILLLVLIMLVVLLRLGFWQLQRAEEKRQLQLHYAQQHDLSPLSLALFDSWRDDPSLRHRRLALTGRFDNRRAFLLDNRVYQGVVGYEVLSPFHTDSGPTFLINRGWIEGFADRRKLPNIPAIETEVSLVGAIYIPLGEPVTLGDDIWSDGWPQVVQWPDIERIGALLEGALFPYSVRLEADQPGALVVDWTPINTRPEKHTGYAVQWFLMAAAMVVFWLYSSIRPPKNPDGETHS